MSQPFKTIIEPFRIKSVEPIGLLSTHERQIALRQAHYNLFGLPAQAITIDLLTDSGTSAMSAQQWSALMNGDESYAGSRSFYEFESKVKELTGLTHIFPTHQGRASERILFSILGGPGKCFPNNNHFDTTRANIEATGSKALDLVCAQGKDPSFLAPFKGNIDLTLLQSLFETRQKDIPACFLTVTNNSGGGQPVSMQNIRDTHDLCQRYKIPFFLDACRFAENAYFIKLREPEFKHSSVRAIVKEMFSYADGFTMSVKKDGFANIGGILAVRDAELADRIREVEILTEGFPTYGGLAGRDLAAIAVGLEEVLDEHYLNYRITSTAYLGQALIDSGVPIVMPVGGHAVYIDAKAFLPHMNSSHLPGQALACELYLEGGVRSVEIGTLMFGEHATMELVRLAIPRRVYTQSHIDYVIEVIQRVFNRRESIKGLNIVAQPKALRHFTAKLEPR